MISKPRRAAARWVVILAPWETCFTVQSDCVLTRTSPQPPNTPLFIFSPASPSSLLPSALHLPWIFSFTTTSSMLPRDALERVFQAQILSNPWGNLVQGRSAAYSSKITSRSTRDGMHSCQSACFSSFAFGAGSSRIRKFCVCGVEPTCSSLLFATICNIN